MVEMWSIYSYTYIKKTSELSILYSYTYRRKLSHLSIYLWKKCEPSLHLHTVEMWPIYSSPYERNVCHYHLHIVEMWAIYSSTSWRKMRQNMWTIYSSIWTYGRNVSHLVIYTREKSESSLNMYNVGNWD